MLDHDACNNSHHKEFADLDQLGYHVLFMFGSPRMEHVRRIQHRRQGRACQSSSPTPEEREQ